MTSKLNSLEILIMKFTIFSALSMCICAFITSGCMSQIYDKVGLSEDNSIEEIAEMAIEHYTGVDVDITPGSEE